MPPFSLSHSKVQRTVSHWMVEKSLVGDDFDATVTLAPDAPPCVKSGDMCDRQEKDDDHMKIPPF